MKSDDMYSCILLNNLLTRLHVCCCIISMYCWFAHIFSFCFCLFQADVGAQSRGLFQLCTETSYVQSQPTRDVEMLTVISGMGPMRSAYEEVHCAVMSGGRGRGSGRGSGRGRGSGSGSGSESEVVAKSMESMENMECMKLVVEEQGQKEEDESVVSVTPAPLFDMTGEPAITQYHFNGGCSVDYILFTETNIRVDGVLEMLDWKKVHQAKFGTKGKMTDSLPNKWWGSDHISLVADFTFI